MKITYNTYNEKEIKEFKELKQSNVFYHNDDMYMVTETITDSYGEYWNAVNLSNGELVMFENDEIVELADYEFRVNK